MPFLLPNQQRQSTEGNSTEGNHIVTKLSKNSLDLARIVFDNNSKRITKIA